MKILLLAPHPFYSDRGTPIAVNLLLSALSSRGHTADVLTYSEGRDVKYDGVRIFRIPRLPWIQGIRPGFSFKKVICDIFMFFKAVKLIRRNSYHVIHAVEESVFTALILKWIFRIPYIYDVDSSLPQQMIEAYPLLKVFVGFLNFFERLAIQRALAIVVVCESLEKDIEKYQPLKTIVLHDVCVVSDSQFVANDLKLDLKITGLLCMYVGNLAEYQGIDLLLESFKIVLQKIKEADLVIIGGDKIDIQKYQKKSKSLSISEKVHFVGPKPVEYLSSYLLQADMLFSPRIKGKNTPMKLYSYLGSGRPIVATDLATHTQVLSPDTAVLTSPTPEAFAHGALKLIENADLREKIGNAGKRLIEEKYTYGVFKKKIHALYVWIEHTVLPKRDPMCLNDASSCVSRPKENTTLSQGKDLLERV
jgi:glycosyltransferase involved in cell wall biosynthesis